MNNWLPLNDQAQRLAYIQWEVQDIAIDDRS